MQDPPLPVDDPWQARQNTFTALKMWCDKHAALFAQQPERWHDLTGLGHGEYWWQAWRWRHRQALGLDADEIGELTTDAERPLAPVALRNWWSFFTEYEAGEPVVAELQQRWAALPGPDQLGPDEVRERLKAIEDWYRRYLGHTAWEPDIEIIETTAAPTATATGITPTALPPTATPSPTTVPPTMTATATRTRISAYSTRPCPCSFIGCG